MRDINFKAGDRVRIRSWEDMRKEFGEDHETIRCKYSFISAMKHLCMRTAILERVDSDGHIRLSSWSNDNGDMIWSFSTDMIERVEDNRIITYRDGNKVISKLEVDGKVIKTAEARCCPTDEFDFSVGAKLSVERLLEDKVKVGDYIELISTNYTFDEVGMKLKVDRLGKNGFVYVLPTSYPNSCRDVYKSCVSHDGAWSYKKEWYKVLENYTPPKSNKGRDLIGREIKAGTKFKVINVDPHVEINGVAREGKGAEDGVLLPDAYKNMTGTFKNSFTFDEYKFVGKPIFDKDYLNGIDKENELLLRWDEVEILD